MVLVLEFKKVELKLWNLFSSEYIVVRLIFVRRKYFKSMPKLKRSYAMQLMNLLLVVLSCLLVSHFMYQSARSCKVIHLYSSSSLVSNNAMQDDAGFVIWMQRECEWLEWLTKFEFWMLPSIKDENESCTQCDAKNWILI